MKNNDLASFAKVLGSAIAICIAVAAYPVYKWYGLSAFIGFMLAFFVTSLNAIVGYYFVDKYFGASLNDFMKAVFGSMGVRLLVLAGIIVIVLVFTKIHRISFTVSLFISYILFSVIEINFINKKVSKPDSES